MSHVNFPPNAFSKFGNYLAAFWQFCRPHTIVGTSLSVLALFLIVLSGELNHNLNLSLIFEQYMSENRGEYLEQVFRQGLGQSLGQVVIQFIGTWLACLAGNIYIVGLNQLEDIEIDKINKPHLPLASGEFSPQTGRIIVILCGGLALILAALLGKFLLLMVGTSLVIGTAYSQPPIRLKRLPVFAALCILVVRGLVINLGLFAHFQAILFPKSNLLIPTTVWAITWFILVFTIAIALGKDIPDMEGDRQYNISTFTIKLGKTAVFNICRSILTVVYLGMILGGIFWLPQVNQLFLIISHGFCLALLWWQSWGIDLESQTAIAKFYQFIWKLFFLEYLIFPLACLWI